MNILLTGGCGFIGSHTAVELSKQGNKIIIVDCLDNSDLSVINQIEKITGVRPVFFCQDITDGVDNIMETHNIDAVIHFAAHKAVGESVMDPLK